MYYNFPILFQKEFPGQLENLLELIDELFEKLKAREVKVRWTKYKYFDEYGFYVDNKDKSVNLFCGLYFDLWQTKGMPFCLSLDWKRTDLNSLKFEFEKISAKIESEVKFIVFEDYPIIYFTPSYFEQEDLAVKLVDTIKTITEHLKFGVYFKVG